MKKRSRSEAAAKPELPGFPAAGTWERAWQRHWSKVGLPGYELPQNGVGKEDREFLNAVRSPEKQRARLNRFSDEFSRAFNELFEVGPAVTVFGSACFKETHPYYRLARETGAELAKAGFGYVTDSPQDAVDLILRSLPLQLRQQLKPNLQTVEHATA